MSPLQGATMSLGGNEIRKQFLEFFRTHGHTVVPSASLVPERDPSLLFTNAGMVQFKHVFLGSETRSYTRAVDAQKCLRVSGKHNDLEDVGRDECHHTFFEMLGNWSFGDYGKREAIAWAWELLTGQWKLPKERLWATVHTSDDEAALLWREVTDIARDRVLRCGAENFWEMAETGPCGPCSEIHIDRGPDACDRRGVSGHVCAVNGCARFLELWNLVFIQFNRGAGGTLAELPVRHVDTGMGLERIAAVLQGVRGNYEGDLLREVIREGERLSGVRYGADPATDVSLRVIADHARAGTFLVADGVLPSNEGRGYVLRRLLRRAARHGKLLGLDAPFLHRVSGVVSTLMGEAYSEVATQRAHIADTIRAEEERFATTLDRGLALLQDEVRQAKTTGDGTLPGAAVFRLYDTYGFPVDLTEDILRVEGMRLDHAGFERCMGEQRERARGAQRFRDMAAGPGPGGVTGLDGVRFVGDRLTEWESEVRGVAGEDGEWRTAAHEGELVDLVTPETPFYAEAGGQVGDTGIIETARGARIEVADTRKAESNLIVHRGRVVRGVVQVGDAVVLRIDAPRREATRLNHSATHILHAVLRDLLGGHVRQAGSLVAPHRLRFDFSHGKAIDDTTVARIEERVNAHIRENTVVTHEEMVYDDAMRLGALAFFGDAYGERVRVVRMGDFSIELCGGTHVQRTGDIGVFKIRGESGVAAGIRRMEAVSGKNALDWIWERERILREIAVTMKSPEAGLQEKLERLLEQQRELERRVAGLQQRLAGGGAGDLLAAAREVDGIKVVAARVDDADSDGLRTLADRLRERLGSGVVVLGAVQGDRVQLVAAVTKDLTGRLHAGNLVKRVAEAVGGRGGGRPDFAQAGGGDAARLGSALAAAEDHVREQLAGRPGSRALKSDTSSAG